MLLSRTRQPPRRSAPLGRPWHLLSLIAWLIVPRVGDLLRLYMRTLAADLPLHNAMLSGYYLDLGTEHTARSRVAEPLPDHISGAHVSGVHCVAFNTTDQSNYLLSRVRHGITPGTQQSEALCQALGRSALAETWDLGGTAGAQLAALSMERRLGDAVQFPGCFPCHFPPTNHRFAQDAVPEPHTPHSGIVG